MRKLLCVLLALLMTAGTGLPALAAASQYIDTVSEQKTADEPSDSENVYLAGAVTDTAEETERTVKEEQSSAEEKTSAPIRTATAEGTTPVQPTMGVDKDLLNTIGDKAISYVGRTVYTYMVNNEMTEDAPLVAFAASFAAGVETSKLIEIQKMLADMSEQLTAIQSQISSLSNQMSQEFQSLEDTVLKGQYTSLVNLYITPVENEIGDSWQYYMFINYKALCYSTSQMDDGDDKTAAEKQAEEMKDSLTSMFGSIAWSDMESNWDAWLAEGNGEEDAFEKAYAAWEEKTAKINFTVCLQNLTNLMTSTAGSDTLLSVQEQRLRNLYPLEHQITDSMCSTLQYVSDLLGRVLVLYYDYVNYMNDKECIEYTTEEEATSAQNRINARTEAYHGKANAALEAIADAEKNSGIKNMMTASDIHRTLTLENGETIDVYKVKANSDRKCYYIAKDSPLFSDAVEERVSTDTYTVTLKYALTSNYLEMMQSADRRYKIVSYEDSGRSLDGLLADCSGDVLLFLRKTCGLDEIDAATTTIMTSKTDSKTSVYNGEHYRSITYYYYMWHLDIATFDKNQNGLDQYVEFEVEDVLANEDTLHDTAYGDLRYLRIYCDMHLGGNPARGTIAITQLSEINNESVLIDGDTLDLSNTAGNAQNKTIYVSGNVRVIGGGSENAIQNLTFHVAEGATLTIENLYLTGSSGKSGAICSDGDFTLKLIGTNKISQGSASNAIGGSVTVKNGNNGKLILSAGDGKCVSGGTFNATDITLETSGGSFEVDPDSGSLTNCTINSASGKYDIGNITVSNCTWTNYAPYKFILLTGDITDAGTSNDLYLTINDKKITISDDLDRGTKQTLYGYGPALTSAPDKLKLETSGINAWYGVSVQVYSNMTNYKSVDGRWMVCQWVEDQTDEIANNNYGAKLTIITSTDTNSGTDANIYAALGYLDSAGNLKTGEFVDLSERISGNAFENGDTETVYIAQNDIPSTVALDDCKYIVFKSDMANAAAGWKIYSVNVQKMTAGNTKMAFTLVADQWIVDEDYQYAFTNDNSQSRQYYFTVVTGTKTNAGTNSNLSFQLVGTKGTTNWVTANDCILGDAFEKGDTDTFMLTFDKNIGTITGVNVKSDRTGSASGWYCSSVKVAQYNTLGGTYGQTVSVSVNAWFDSSSNATQCFSGSSVKTVSASKPTDGSEGTVLEVSVNQGFTDYTKLHIYRADTIDGEYVEVFDLGKDEFTGLDKNLVEGETYYYKIFEETEDGIMKQSFRIFCLKAGTGFVEIAETKVEAEALDSDDITAGLNGSGFDTVSDIETALISALQKLNNTITNENIAFYDLQLYYQDGEEWLPADESYFPEDGQLFVSIPVPEGSDPATDTYYIVHMFSEDLFGKKAGDIEVAEIETHTGSDGQLYLDFYVTGLSPVAIGWSGESGTPETGDNSNLTMWVIIAALSGAALVVTGSKFLPAKKRR